jgi:ABC-2 type transport system permease protein
MANIWIIARRELKQYFISPIAYAVSFMILLIVGIIFYANVLSAAQQGGAPDLQIVMSPLVTIFLFVTPAITMRSLAEEQRSGTLELLLSAPVRDWELVVGKWLGGFLFVMIILATTWIYPIILNQIIKPGIDQGLLISGYLGLALLTGSFIAIGVAASSLFSNQIAAFFTTLGIMLVLWMLGFAGSNMSGTSGEIVRYLDISEHFYSTFNMGLIQLKDIIYYCSVIAFSLFLGSISIEIRRWR